ncbi:RepB family plasmid replication initiator protein [Rodentibacter rarus]|uniref:RepB family plasmid replication initiator protein n=1 Tax=Rodentibacter rarus TaxID=1908260 RepID=A0A1V3INW8_9PAST|nr:replication initiation protein [Rodentibacter rarus]OOF43826.1 RepB family plasmid replication initiator protein [Rodentibacter rarus]
MSNNTDLTISKANSFVQASYSMTLDEMRILSLTLGVFNPKNPSKRGFDFTVADFCKHFPDVNPEIAYTQVRNAVLKISKRWVTLVDNEHELTEVALIHKRSYFKKEGRFYIEFHDELIPYISELHENYTKYQLVNIGAFSSTHAIRLYELCSQYRDTGWRQTSIEDLKDWFQVSDKYSLYANFRKWVIEPSIAEINAKSDLLVSYEPIKRGRSIVALKFTIQTKKSAVKTELKRPKFPHKNKYGKFVKLDRQNPKMSSAEYGNYAKDCLKILEDFYQNIEDVPNEDLLFYWIFLSVNESHKSRFGRKQIFAEKLRERGYKIIDCELVEIDKKQIDFFR